MLLLLGFELVILHSDALASRALLFFGRTYLLEVNHCRGLSLSQQQRKEVVWDRRYKAVGQLKRRDDAPEPYGVILV